MRNMLALVALLVIAFLAVGYFQDWYKVRGVPSPDGQRSLAVDINTKKIGQDLQKAEDSIQKKLEEKARAAREEAARQQKEKDRPTKSTSAATTPTVDFSVITD
ncbi:MAG: hypothetical protein U0736_18590 [Gemmataceae bacterium]